MNKIILERIREAKKNAKLRVTRQDSEIDIDHIATAFSSLDKIWPSSDGERKLTPFQINVKGVG